MFLFHRGKKIIHTISFFSLVVRKRDVMGSGFLYKRWYVVDIFSAQTYVCTECHKATPVSKQKPENKTLLLEFFLEVLHTDLTDQRQIKSHVFFLNLMGHFGAQLGSFLHLLLLSAVSDSDLTACRRPGLTPTLQKLDWGHGSKASAYPTESGSTCAYQPHWSASE